MPIEKSRITGFGSSGGEKIWHCPEGHLLQPWKATPGICDGCQAKIHKGDCVMDCRECNYYLCEACHPQEKDDGDWLWGSLSYFAEATAQEFTEITTEFTEMAGDLETLVADMSPFAMCAAPQIDKSDTDFSIPNKKGKKPLGAKNRVCEEEEAAAERDRDLRDREQINNYSTADLLKKPVRGKGDDAAAKRGQQAPRAKAQEVEPQAKKAQEQAVEEPAPPLPSKPVEDLMDLGQHDLLDLDFEPAPAVKAPAVAAPAVHAPAAHSVGALPDLLFDLGDAEPALPVVAKPVAAAFDEFHLDFDTPSAAAGAPTRTTLFSLAPPPAPAASLIREAC